MGNLSIRKKLPLLIGSLVLLVILAFSAVSYLGLKKASLKEGASRLQSVTAQLSNMFGQSTQNFIQSSRSYITNDTIKRFLMSGGNELRTEASDLLGKLTTDSLSIRAAILDSNKNFLLESGRPAASVRVDIKQVIPELSLGPDSIKVGKIIRVGDSLFYPVVGAISRNKKIIGYTTRWRLLKASPMAIDQFSKLLGTGAVLFVGNKDGSLWTDLIKPVGDPRSNHLMELAQPIPNSPWQVMVGFPKKLVLKGATTFLATILMIGAVLVIIAFAAAWLLSRNITDPLKDLTLASSSIAAGDYSKTVPAERKDELGELARAFNSMMVQVHNAQVGLEKKVQERTTQLQASNKELEAFSYSVSHDLRAPLRAISGYAVILKEDYGTRLDDEAHRITDKIINSARMMGQLIDSLIAFSQMGASAIVTHRLNMKKMAETCVNEILGQEAPGKYKVIIHDMPSCEGDPNLVKQVWTNLISNAIKYSSKSTNPQIEIGCTAGTEMNIYYVRDNGVGFDMNYYHKLFGVFQRLHNQRDFEGTGIGLAFTKRIITKHKGDIWAEAKPGQGACFYFSLPAKLDLKREITENEYSG